jgi:hypothetical protein
MDTYGVIDRIHHNGVISYKGSETHADGTPAFIESFLGSDNDEWHEEEDSEEDEVEVVLGKGFDYSSSEEGDEAFGEENGHDDFNEIMGTNQVEDSVTNEKEDADDVRPNSFSRIDAKNTKENQDFRKCEEVVVDLSSGDVLYLPAGFFHSVTSFSNNKNEGSPANKNASTFSGLRPHMALNYWYHPPDCLDSFESPYSHPSHFSN